MGDPAPVEPEGGWEGLGGRRTQMSLLSSQNGDTWLRQPVCVYSTKRIAFLPGGKSTRVQVWLLIQHESPSRIEFIQAPDLLACENPCDSPSLTRMFLIVAANPSS